MTAKKKIKSFGIIEAVIASGIVVIVLSGALALSSSSLRSASLGSSYLEAEHIADNLMEKVAAAKAAKKVFFVSPEISSQNIFSIDCFDTDAAKRTAPGCKKSGSYREEVPYTTDSNITKEADGSYFVKVKQAEVSNAFPDDFFNWQIKVVNNKACPSVGSIVIPQEKCRFIEVNVKWQESSGEKQYHLTQYFGDWQS